MKIIGIVEDIKDFINKERITHGKWNGKVYVRGEHVQITDKMLTQPELIIECKDGSYVDLSVSEYMFRIYRYQYLEGTPKEIEDLTEKWHDFLCSRHPEFAKELKEYAENRIKEFVEECEEKVAQYLKEIEKTKKGYNRIIEDCQKSLEIANNYLDSDDKELN